MRNLLTIALQFYLPPITTSIFIYIVGQKSLQLLTKNF